MERTNFYRTGIFNTHNFHYWDYVNPQIVRNDHFQNRFEINIWAEILDGILIGAFQFLRRANTEFYLNFLQELNNLFDSSVYCNSKTESEQTIYKLFDWKRRDNHVSPAVTVFKPHSIYIYRVIKNSSTRQKIKPGKSCGKK